MNKYIIKQYTYDKLNKLNNTLETTAFSIKKSKTAGKKIDVFMYDKKIASIGAIKSNGVPYLDYPSYIEIMGQKYANRRKKLYYERHNKEPTIKDGEVTNSWWSKYLLW